MVRAGEGDSGATLGAVRSGAKVARRGGKLLGSEAAKGGRGRGDRPRWETGFRHRAGRRSREPKDDPIRGEEQRSR